MASVSQTTSFEANGGRIGERFARLRADGARALITYLTAGYPRPADTGALLDAVADGGADVIELGVPFSDPLADGPTIQRASQRALESGVTLAWTLEQLSAFRARSATPVVLFTYLNPVLGYGVDRFLRDARDAGADGVLLTDLPVGSDAALEEAFEGSPLALVRLIAPTTPPDRAARIASRAQGFLYYISRTGVTGATRTLRSEIGREVEALRAHARAPIAVGFGISTPDQAAEVARAADGVVVGSALIDALDRGGAADLVALVRSLAAAVHRVDDPVAG
ncbi:MAG TPA: tryptophan synthase subunit alpha [Longimicrobiales bacterium]